MTIRRELILILGGARSGKSAFAERLARSCGPRVLYVATAQAGDAEMEERIANHQAARPDTWTTVEEPLRLAEAVGEAKGFDAVLVDCLTLWVSNRMLAAQGEEPQTVEDVLLAEVGRVLDTHRRGAATLILVSNEVGLGLVPPNPLGRAYRDLLGRVNQTFAEAANRVYMLVAGVAVDVKALPGAVLTPSGRPPERPSRKRLYTTGEAERIQRLLEARERRRGNRV
ncbi:MAG: bifunctional adenosylcobinamide kinase/adenosylcobinamide-phosphate guanylyltransferase [Dehalococcoidia bacterium]|nr:bifunctional adenosylcobinamide kinase/adenosylcobinamide-phosphate guanylyltransferase [Dehalococcoidia bacterium]